MQDPARYLASLHKPFHMQPPMCLQYTILALAASLSPDRKELAQAFYQRARNYMQFDEMRVRLNPTPLPEYTLLALTKGASLG